MHELVPAGDSEQLVVLVGADFVGAGEYARISLGSTNGKSILQL